MAKAPSVLMSLPFLAREESPGSWPGAGTIRLEQDVFSALAGQGQIYVHLTDGIWSQIKSAGYVGVWEETASDLEALRVALGW